MLLSTLTIATNSMSVHPACVQVLPVLTTPCTWMGSSVQTLLILGYMSNPGDPPIGMVILMEWSRRAAGNGKSPAVGIQRKSMWDQAPTRQP
ncbi:hypothetical protein ILYODFUR_028323 [Ilyodon furcidens]|uniref:Uncharacterized protein n=1 Tax=Ilyodon furcidens TaxID=33524 RepID=A0ABV0U237_9TELE